MSSYTVKFVGVSYEYIPTLVDELFNQGTTLSTRARNNLTRAERQRIEQGEPIEIKFWGDWLNYHEELERLSRELNCTIVLSIHFVLGGIRLVFDVGRCKNTYLI